LSSEVLPNINFKRGMGGKNLWVWNNTKTEFITKASRLIVGKTRDFVLELNIPKSTYKTNGLIELPVVNVVLTAEGFAAGGGVEVYKKSVDLKISFFTEGQEFKEEDSTDPEIATNFFRLKLAETMEEAKKFAENGNYEEAKKILIALQEELINCKYFNNEKFKLLVEEVKIALRDVTPQVWAVSGSHNLTSNMQCNYKQKSVPTNVNYGNYSNNIQQQMNFDMKMMKKK
jgi:hypothetical protein